MLIVLVAVLCGFGWGAVHGRVWPQLNIPWMARAAQSLQGIRHRPNRRRTEAQPESFPAGQKFLAALLGTGVTGGILGLLASGWFFVVPYGIGLFAGFSPALIKRYWRAFLIAGTLFILVVAGFEFYGERPGSGEQSSLPAAESDAVQPDGLEEHDSSAPDGNTSGKNLNSRETAESPPIASPQPSPLEARRESPKDSEEIILRGVPFAFNAEAVQPEFLAVLNETVRILTENPDVSVLIEGHTDAVGSEPFNLRLSHSRAEAVRNYLVQQGIAAERLRVVGRGEADPLASNAKDDGTDNPEGRAINRRVELSVE